ncbi:DUF488 family protein [Conexibacter sp. CPCC 206217]|uniref:DUF488 domain-containing protein n=1 Tax=Conexibacter sp. CPCC 206217 TaxID=3064574 RepID=UPI00271F7CB4|nr:DUF488 domain-containing protein [Conexibacter sp. CPCC 206217]MDO8214193.1 DUF488 domain-containing protein [Conexibacter sp. CPCC 206217]
MPTIWTIGYERMAPDALVAELQAAGVERVIDVRFRAQSRKPGMSKTKLGARLGEGGIAYEHRRTLGTPPEIRPLFRTGAVRQAADAFRAHVEQTAAQELDALAEELSGSAPATALLCLEAEPSGCHRRVVAEQLQQRRPELRVVDL